MTIKLAKTATQEEIADQLKQLKSVKRLNVKKYIGKLNWRQDALEYQRQLRNK